MNEIASIIKVNRCNLLCLNLVPFVPDIFSHPLPLIAGVPDRLHDLLGSTRLANSASSTSTASGVAVMTPVGYKHINMGSSGFSVRRWVGGFFRHNSGVQW